MVETMALIDDTVGLTFVETSEPRVCDGVTISDVCAGIALSVVKDTKDVVIELKPSMDSGGAAIPKVGLFGSKYGKGRDDGSCLFIEGGVEGVCKRAKGKSVEKYSV